MKKTNLIFQLIFLNLFLLSITSCEKDDHSIVESKTQNGILQEVMRDVGNFKIAFGDTRKIYMMNPDGSSVEQLADGSPISGYVSWSPNAKYVYYASAKGPAETAWEA